MIGRESRFLPTPPAFDAPVAGARLNIATNGLEWKKNTMVWLPDGEKDAEDVFIRFDRIHERDRQMDTA